MKKHDKFAYDVINRMTQEELNNDNYYFKMSKYCDHILLYPNTNRYHANYLFRKLIDFAQDNDFNYYIYDKKTKEYKACDLMDKSLKDVFYKFCYDNTYRTIYNQ